MSEPALELILATTESTQELGFRLGQQVSQQAMVALYGPLGAGKTSFAKGAAAGLGVQEVVVSPTFTMLNEYMSGRIPLFHLDLYRLHESAAGDREFLIDQLEELSSASGLILIEWAELLASYIEDRDHVSIALDYLPALVNTSRTGGIPPAPDQRVARLRARGRQSEQIIRAIANVYFS